MEHYKHLMQMIGLIVTLRWLWRDRTDYFAGGNLTVYYSPEQKKSVDFRGPDFFVVQGVDGTRERGSWVVWDEGGRYPDVIVELLSPSTQHLDRGEKKQIYQDIFRTPEYFTFDPESLELEGWRLMGGVYEAIPPDEGGRLPSRQLGLALGVVGGDLRLHTLAGDVVPRPEEEALAAMRCAIEEKQRADEERQRADEAIAELERLRAERR